MEVAPAGLNKVFFSDNGSTAVEAALKMAFQFWRNRGRGLKQRFLKLSGAYHGDTLGAVAVGGIPLFHEIYQPLLFDTLEAPAPYCYRCDHVDDCREQCFARLEELVAAYDQELAAVIVEPVMQGAAGMIAEPPGYLAKEGRRPGGTRCSSSPMRWPWVSAAPARCSPASTKG